MQGWGRESNTAILQRSMRMTSAASAFPPTSALSIFDPSPPMPVPPLPPRHDVRSISKLQLLNLGLRPSQVSPTGVAACSSELVDPLSCCIHYERSVQDGGFVERSKVAVLRNPTTRVRVALAPLCRAVRRGKRSSLPQPGRHPGSDAAGVPAHAARCTRR